MSRPTTKQDLILAANTNYEKLLNLIGTLTETELNTPFHFENDEKKKEAHWKRDQNLKDVLIHLYEWHQLIRTGLTRVKRARPSRLSLSPITGKPTV